jgi:hypothetical protein
VCGVNLEALSGSSPLCLTRRRKKESSLFCFCTRGVGVESVLCVCLRREFLCVYRSSIRDCFLFSCCGRVGLGCVMSVSAAAGLAPVVVMCVWGEVQGV